MAFAIFQHNVNMHQYIDLHAHHEHHAEQQRGAPVVALVAVAIGGLEANRFRRVRRECAVHDQGAHDVAHGGAIAH